MEKQSLPEFKFCSHCKQYCRCEYCDGCRNAKGFQRLTTDEKIAKRPELKQQYGK